MCTIFKKWMWVTEEETHPLETSVKKCFMKAFWPKTELKYGERGGSCYALLSQCKNGNRWNNVVGDCWLHFPIASACTWQIFCITLCNVHKYNTKCTWLLVLHAVVFWYGNIITFPLCECRQWCDVQTLEEYLPCTYLIRLQVMGYCFYLITTPSIILTSETGYTRSIKVSFNI